MVENCIEAVGPTCRNILQSLATDESSSFTFPSLHILETTARVKESLEERRSLQALQAIGYSPPWGSQKHSMGEVTSVGRKRRYAISLGSRIVARIRSSEHAVSQSVHLKNDVGYHISHTSELNDT